MPFQFFEIEFAVRDIPVAQQHDIATALRQMCQVGPEAFHKGKLDLLALFAAGTRRQIDRHHRQIAKVRLNVAAFGVDIRNAKPITTLSGCLRQYKPTPL